MSEHELAILRPLACQLPTIDSALAEMARLSAELTLPRGTVHVISDVHGDDVKLRHVINNASGALRPLVEKLLKDRLTPRQLQEFLTLIFYPRESLERMDATLTDEGQRLDFARQTFRLLFVLIRHLACHFSRERVERVLPAEYRDLLREILHERPCGDEYVDAVVEPLVRQGRAFHLLRLTVRVVRNLAIEELVMGGDFWDRGPRGDRVMEYLMRQPNVTITWGNHDAAWLGACLGQEALVAHVLRLSARYRRFSQLEEGYGITLQPLEQLVRTVYADDPAECYIPRGTGLRETVQMARMQKAAAVMQFKLEGQTIQRNPSFGLEQRRLLHRFELKSGTVEIEGKRYPLRDRHFPTLDPARPYELSREERACLDRIKQSFLISQVLWEHMRFLVGRGSMYICRDDHLIFHGCVAVDEGGAFLPLEVDGKEWRGRELFDALDRVVVRALDRPTDRDRDLLWYLWCGPRSPLFGKDKIATLENDLVADPATHVETKNPYFRLIHEAAFCERILTEFGADPGRGLIVNGHVPVKIDKGESPLKRSGKAITIDGAFSQAYGDHGYTLVLEPGRTYLAKHHHFESVEAAVRDGVDIIPEVTEVRRWDPPRRVADTERGDEIRARLELLGRLIEAYRANKLRQGG
ncbi:MAG: fructose-1,6-bisphosphatase [Gemmataceae bacterium]|nr:fructose-1,6-bisphosphatase [Gemmataceae bacterium]